MEEGNWNFLQGRVNNLNCFGNASGTFTGMTYATSIPTTVVGTNIPTKLVGTVYFDKSFTLHGAHCTVPGVHGTVHIAQCTLYCAHYHCEYCTTVMPVVLSLPSIGRNP